MAAMFLMQFVQVKIFFCIFNLRTRQQRLIYTLTKERYKIMLKHEIQISLNDAIVDVKSLLITENLMINLINTPVNSCQKILCHSKHI